MLRHESWPVMNSVPASMSIPPRSQEFYTNSGFKPPPGTSERGHRSILPKKTKEFLRTFHGQGHQVCFIRFLIVPNRQQRTLRCDRKPAVVHSNQELNNFFRCVSPRFRAWVLHFPQNRRKLGAEVWVARCQGARHRRRFAELWSHNSCWLRELTALVQHEIQKAKRAARGESGRPFCIFVK